VSTESLRHSGHPKNPNTVSSQAFSRPTLWCRPQLYLPIRRYDTRTKLISPGLIAFPCSRNQSPSAKSVHQIGLPLERRPAVFQQNLSPLLHPQGPLASLNARKRTHVQTSVRFRPSERREDMHYSVCVRSMQALPAPAARSNQDAINAWGLQNPPLF
jgi:hypothetical protein